jgi:hypothetical protein
MNTVTYWGLRGLEDGLWIWWSNLLNIYTTGYNISQITIWHTVIFSRLNWTRLSLDYDSLWLLVVKVKVQFTLRLTVSQSVSRGILLLFDSYGLDFVWRSLWREDGSAFYTCICCWPLASLVFLGSESLGTRDHILLSQIWDFTFRRLLRLAGSRWRYSSPPTHGEYSILHTVVLITSRRGLQTKHFF